MYNLKLRLMEAKMQDDCFSGKISGTKLKKFSGDKLSADSSFAEDSTIYSGVTFRPGISLTMEEQTFIGNNCTILVPKLVMKKGSQINAGAILFGREPVTLDENVVVSYNAIISTSTDTQSGKHMNDASPENERFIKQAPVHICANSFVGANCYIAPGVTILPDSVIGAGVYISRDVPANKVVIPEQKLLIKDREII